MKSRMVFSPITALLILFLLVNPTLGQDSEPDEQQEKSNNRQGWIKFSDGSILLPITAIEWGAPDRWSFTSLYVSSVWRAEDEVENKKTWHHNLHASLSPGLSGGRFGIGYGLIFDPPESRNFGIVSSCRAVLLRSWGNPLSASPDRTYAGAEFKVSLSIMFSVSVGYYSQISDSGDDEKEQFWGFHCGVGI